MWCRVFNFSMFNSTSSHISSKFISCSIWEIKRNRDSKRMIIFVLFINFLIITLIFVSEFINSMILTTSSMIIFALENSQTYHCFSFFCVIDRNLIELTWNLITFSSERILKKIFWTSETKTITSCYAPVLSTGTSHLATSPPLSIRQACLTVLVTHQSIGFLDSLIMLRFSASELKNEQEISDESSTEWFTKRFISWYSHHELKTT